ncbi:MAG: ABC-F family ATP-binding cassette domain-containing protein [Bacteroidetes bacterium]|nr:ABC-F family ATP-binding cassette domain-containing protein [Bacteroidota bacterium]MBK8144592.1 ABC-F family ATP-binding cassette domain-containing protein [Bacteroidota bacterium]MBP6314141.1 ABC-F family ATP-binding cassette domain-containing protein [Chitinophagaceae bacterium]
MHYASVENISKSFGIRVLFKELTFHIEEGDKIALVARNGFGKSTLLHIIAGKDYADSGSVWIHKDIQLVMLHQENEFQEDKNIWDNILCMNHPTVKVVKAYEEFVESGSEDAEKMQHLLDQMEHLDAWNFESELKQILSKLNIQHLEQPVRSLSGGQKKRVALAQALVETKLYDGKCLLIMDEPTNHLDIEMIEWLENYLSNQNTTMLMVTHDRYFLDNVCNEIIEIENHQVYIHKGDYNHYLGQKAHRIEVQGSELQKDKNIYRKELEWMRKQPKARTTKSKSRQDHFELIEDRVKQKNVDSEVQLQVKMTRMGGKVLEMKKVYKSYGDKIILKGFDYTFKKGERIGIIGKNGVGKSTFINIALQLQNPDSGKVNHGDTIVFGYFSQEGLQYKEDKRVIDFVKDMAEFFPMADGSKLGASKFLERFAFSAEQQYTTLSKLSGGEKRRLQLLCILFKNPNFLVLDEPTNDLDLQTLQILEEFLLDFAGCILIISHDRYFMDKLVDHLFVFEGEGLVSDFPGNYAQYRVKLLESTLEADYLTEKVVIQKELPISKEPKQGSANKLSFNEKREFELLEKEMPLLELEKHHLETKLSNAELSYIELQQISNQITAIIAQIEEKELRWLELSERMV